MSDIPYSVRGNRPNIQRINGFNFDTASKDYLFKKVDSDNFSQSVINDVDGNVGINKTNPEYSLDVSGTVRATAFIGVSSPDYSSIPDNNIAKIVSGAVSDSHINSVEGSGSNDITIKDSGNSALFHIDTTATLARLYEDTASANQGLYITTTNGKTRIGVNVESPDEDLEVDGNIQLDSASSGRLIYINSSTGDERAELDAEDDGTNGGLMSFHTKVDGGSVTEKMRITNNGRVGINETSPSYTLDVNGDVNVQDDLIVGNTVDVATSLSVGDDITLTASSGNITATQFNGSLSGTASNAVSAQTVEQSSATSADTTYYPLLNNNSVSAGGDYVYKDPASLSYNFTTKTLTTTHFSGELTGGVIIAKSGTESLIFNNPTGGYDKAKIDSNIDGTDGGDLQFYTKEDGGSLGEKLRINNVGAIGIKGANYGISGQVLTSNGSGSAVSWENQAGVYTGGTGVTVDNTTNVISIGQEVTTTSDVDFSSVSATQFNGSLSGNATTASTATNASKIYVNTTASISFPPVFYYPLMADTSTAGNRSTYSDANVYYNFTNEVFRAPEFAGDFTGDVTGNLSGDVSGGINIPPGSLFQINGDAGGVDQILTSNGVSSLPIWKTPILFSAYGVFRCGLFPSALPNNANTGFQDVNALIQVPTPVDMSLDTTNTRDIIIANAGIYLIMYTFNIQQTTGSTHMQGQLALRLNGSNQSNNWQAFLGVTTFQQSWEVSVGAGGRISFAYASILHNSRINSASQLSRILIYRIR
jgi:hypothetical protein